MIDRTIRQSGFESQLEGRASALRRSLTVSETGLWRHLVGKCIGVAFRRQVPLDRFVFDFPHPQLG